MSASPWFPAACVPTPASSANARQPRFEPVIAAVSGAARFYRADADAADPEVATAIEAAAQAGLLAAGAQLALSCRAVPDEGAVARAARRMLVAGLAPSQLALELPLGPRTSNDLLVAAIAACRDLGVTVILDGFAAGGGDFALLQRVRPDFIRLDPDFVEGIASSESRAAMVHAIQRMGASLDIGVIAGGVDSRGALEALCAVGVGHFHGPRIRDAQPAAVLAQAPSPAAAARIRDRAPQRDPRDAGAPPARRPAPALRRPGPAPALPAATLMPA